MSPEEMIKDVKTLSEITKRLAQATDQDLARFRYIQSEITHKQESLNSLLKEITDAQQKKLDMQKECDQLRANAKSECDRMAETMRTAQIQAIQDRDAAKKLKEQMEQEKYLLDRQIEDKRKELNLAAPQPETAGSKKK